MFLIHTSGIRKAMDYGSLGFPLGGFGGFGGISCGRGGVRGLKPGGFLSPDLGLVSLSLLFFPLLFG